MADETTQEEAVHLNRHFRPAILPFMIFIFTTAGYSQVITTSAGNSTWSAPVAVALDAAGNQFVADYGINVIFKVDRLGATTIVAGTMNAYGYAGDGGLATSAKLNYPYGVAVDAAGNIYIGDTNNSRIRKVSTNGIITTIAGTGREGFSGDGSPSVSSQIYNPKAMVVDAAGQLYFVDHSNYRIRKIDTHGIITTIAGTGNQISSGDGGPAVLAGMDPVSLAIGLDASVYFTDSGDDYQASPRVRKIDTNGVVSTVAGTGVRGDSGDGGPATAATFYSVDGIAVDALGDIFVSEFADDLIRKVSPAGIITTYAGTGYSGFSGDGGPATKAALTNPDGMAEGPDGYLYIADFGNRRIRKISPPAGPIPRPTNPGIPAFLGANGFSSNSYLEIYGTNLAQTTRTWAAADFKGPNAPTSLDGVSVSINGKPAYIFYVSPTQININAPDDTATGPVSMQVTNSLGISNMGIVNRARVSPSLQTTAQFTIGGKQYVVAQTPDFRTFIGKTNMISGVPFVAAKPGDTVVIYALGCGPTIPASQAGVEAAQSGSLMLPYSMKIGGVTAPVSFAGIIAGTVGLYQFNVVVPALAAGDQSIELIVDGVSNAQNLSIVIGN